jgi:hypothetical protein
MHSQTLLPKQKFLSRFKDLNLLQSSSARSFTHINRLHGFHNGNDPLYFSDLRQLSYFCKLMREYSLNGDLTGGERERAIAPSNPMLKISYA